MGRLTRRLPNWAWALWYHRPVLTTHARIAHKVDHAEVAGYAHGHIAARIEAGPTRPATTTAATMAGLGGAA